MAQTYLSTVLLFSGFYLVIYRLNPSGWELSRTDPMISGGAFTQYVRMLYLSVSSATLCGVANIQPVAWYATLSVCFQDDAHQRSFLRLTSWYKATPSPVQTTSGFWAYTYKQTAPTLLQRIDQSVVQIGRLLKPVSNKYRASQHFVLSELFSAYEFESSQSLVNFVYFASILAQTIGCSGSTETVFQRRERIQTISRRLSSRSPAFTAGPPGFASTPIRRRHSTQLPVEGFVASA
ncbi:hypothetical protein HPB50_016808 [Hyalomma asiaticum]|uniref:Uncharacterized protein n=1 Tax=Hyalomma asiaticum TaxID=266040 RepID=A0ACB7SGD6_HYAAI|nr:hypothetical protein HPB50_016808 [Hyalomma asiaticum]